MSTRTTSSRPPEVERPAPPVTERLRAYYTTYYRDALGIPGWRELVDVRLADDVYEDARVDRLSSALEHTLVGQRLLNVGCGTGGFNVAAQNAGADAWGVDADAEAVAIASARLEGRALRGAAESLPFRDESFDIVYCYSTLEHVRDAPAAVAEMVRVLRPGGALYLHAPSRWACVEGHYKVFWIPGLPRWAGRAYLAGRGRPTAFLETLRPVTLAECRGWLMRAGAHIARVLTGGVDRRVGGALWPLVRFYYRVSGVRPYVEIVAIRGDRT
jgi:SAM-dependent methyltransferase